MFGYFFAVQDASVCNIELSLVKTLVLFHWTLQLNLKIDMYIYFGYSFLQEMRAAELWGIYSRQPILKRQIGVLPNFNDPLWK